MCDERLSCKGGTPGRFWNLWELGSQCVQCCVSCVSAYIHPSTPAAGRAFQQGVHTDTDSLTLSAYKMACILPLISPPGPEVEVEARKNQQG